MRRAFRVVTDTPQGLLIATGLRPEWTEIDGVEFVPTLVEDLGGEHLFLSLADHAIVAPVRHVGEVFCEPDAMVWRDDESFTAWLAELDA